MDEEDLRATLKRRERDVAVLKDSLAQRDAEIRALRFALDVQRSVSRRFR
jgi:hypothetical protein